MPDYYSDNPGPDTMTEDAPPSSDDGNDKPAEDSGDHPTALIPKSLLAGKDFKPGDEMVVRIDRILEDQVEISYAPEKPGKGDSEPEDYSEGGDEMPMGDSRMRSYME